MSSPRPGRPVRGSHSGRPIMALLDLLGRRMALRILWELRHGPLTFRGLQAAADTNPGVLNTRLKELREAQIVERRKDGYRLTRHGEDLIALWHPLGVWAENWAQSLEPPPAAGGKGA